VNKLKTLTTLVRMRGLVLLVLSVLAALLAAKGGISAQQLGFWDGPG
jgi:hypothetical protein